MTETPAVPTRPRTARPWWPGPEERAAPVVVPLAATMAGLVAAVSVPLDRPGIGWLVMGIGVTAAITLAARSLGAERTRSRPLWTVVTLALLAVGTLRASGWLFTLCVLTACVTASLAVAGGRSVRALVLGAVAVPFAALRDLPWVVRGARQGTGRSTVRLGVTVAVSVALVVVFGALLAGADAAFATLIGRLVPAVHGASAVEWLLVFVVIALGVAGACSVLAAPPPRTSGNAGVREPLRRIEWALPVAVLVALFGAFVALQLTFLFGGSDYVLRTAGLTYAEYARRGFWQLCAVTVLTLAVIGVAARRAARATVADRVWLRALLGALTALTLVIVGSALVRMWAYQQAYGFTVLRVLVSACELWLGLVYLMVLAAGVRLRAGWLPLAVVGTAVTGLLLVAALDPDRFIADRNIDRWERAGRIDLEYLGRLSPDAFPALRRLPEPLRSCAMTYAASDLLHEVPGWRGWNLARDRARDLVLDVPLAAPQHCASEVGG